jgi:hypothetical protein
MNSAGWFILAVSAVLTVWWLFTLVHAKRHSVDRRRDRDPHGMHCVEVRHRGRGCDDVRRFAAVRFLPDEAPRLPVEHCAARNCRCLYVHHDDRRQADRRNPYGLASSQPPASVGAERRSMSDRRKGTDATPPRLRAGSRAAGGPNADRPPARRF